MVTTEMTINEIRAKGLGVLLKELGPTGYVCFLHQFERGRGDFTLERQAWVDKLNLNEVKQLLDRT